jgi:intein/homing endonuclease
MSIKELVERYNNGEKDFKVLSMNTNTFETEYKDVENALLTRENANIIEIECEDGNILKLTPDHKVFTENRGYVNASELRDDDVIITL